MSDPVLTNAAPAEGSGQDVAWKLGCSPIVWNNEEFDDLVPPVPFERVLDEIAAAGFAGTEIGRGFPDDPAGLRAALAARGLALAGAWCGLDLVDPARAAADLARAEAVARRVAAAGGRFLNLAHAGTPERRAHAGHAARPAHGTDATAGEVRSEVGPVPALDAAGWERLAARVEAAARIGRRHGLAPVFHPHAGTYVETEAEIEEFARRVDPELVGWCCDCGHLLVGGVDPVAFVRRHGARIAYVHLKDVDGGVLERLRVERRGWEWGLRHYLFAEPGAGIVDLAGLLAALREVGYAGWLMVEQDTSRLTPRAAAETARATLRRYGL